MEYRYEGHSLKSGIYKITNKLNGRIYIGSAKRFKERWQSHAYSLRKQKHSNKFLQADFNKCGEEAFVFEVIEVTEGKSKEERLLIEEKYIKEYYDKKGNTCYNLTTRAVSPEGCELKNSEETKIKRSNASKAQWENTNRREKHINDMRAYWESEEGKNHSLVVSNVLKERWSNDEEYKHKMLERLSGTNNPMYGKHGFFHPRFGSKHSTGTKQKQALGRSKPIQQYTKAGELVAEYYGAKEASKQTGIVYENIIQAANGKAKTAGGFVWIYMNAECSEVKTIRKKRTISQESEKKRIDCLRKKTIKSVGQYTKEGEFIATFSSIVEAANQTDTKACSISSCLKGRYKTANGYVWRYIS